MKQLIFDIETKKTFDQVGGYHPQKLGISFVGAIFRHGLPEEGRVEEKTYQFFEKDFDQLWPLMQTADVLVGYNSDNFDLPALSSYYPGDISLLPSLDLLSRVKASLGRRIGLDALAKLTLGEQKTGTGLDAITYYQNQDWDSLAKYCIKDVQLTRGIYDYGRQHGYLSFLNKWNNPVNIDVDFSFSVDTTPGVQMALV